MKLQKNNDALMNKKVLTKEETVLRAKAEGYPLTDYTLRRAIKSGAIPCRKVGKRYFISWDNVVRWITCADGADNTSDLTETSISGIRPVTL